MEGIFASNAATLGFASSIITELLKVFPKLNEKPIYRAAIAILVTAVVTLVANKAWSFDAFVSSLAFAFASYKMVVQPVAESIGSPTQE